MKLELQQQQIREILQEYGGDTLSYFHLQDRRKYFFSPSGKAFLSYGVWNKVAIVASDPVGPEEEIALLLTSFIQYAGNWKLKPIFVGLSFKYLTFLNSLNLKILKLGEEAVIDLQNFERDSLKKKVRRAVRHNEQLGIEVFFCTPQTLPQSFANELNRISKNWLRQKGRKEKGFVMTLGRIPTHIDKDCQFALAIKNNKVLGFISFTPIYKERMLSLDISRRYDNSCNGLTEFLIIKSAEYFKSRGIKKISLNFVAFAGMFALKKSIKHKIFSTVSQLLKFIYKSDSLQEFNQKFLPAWQDRYVAYTSKINLPLYMLAILRAERL